MADWDDGYVTDVAYTAHYHRETSPVWIATACALLGLGCPALDRPFRFADLGCGNGVTALVVAATMPNAEVWGFDFNPAHIEAGRDVARRAGLTNINFEEVSFDELANLPKAALPPFDFIAAHGVLSWISVENRRRLIDAIGQHLAPGGIAYISYNVATGWVGIPPVRVLMRLLVEASPERTDLAVADVLATLDKMKQAGAAMFQAHPALDRRLTMLRGQDHRYVAHELLNRDWHPVMFHSVASAMAKIKCEYIGSATLMDNIPGFTIPVPLREMFEEARDTGLRETLRDFALASGFRRDLYQRGQRRMTPTEFSRQTDAIGLARTFRAPPEKMELVVPLGRVSLNEPLYQGLLDVLDTGPMTIGQIREQKVLPGWQPGTVREAVASLLDADYLAPTVPGIPGRDALEATDRLNGVHAALLDIGVDRPFLALAGLGAAWHADGLDVLAIDELRARGAVSEGELTKAVVQRLNQSGLQLNHAGEPVVDADQANEIAGRKIEEFIRVRLPTMRGLGLLHDTTMPVA